jgi:hypothetical protein
VSDVKELRDYLEKENSQLKEKSESLTEVINAKEEKIKSLRKQKSLNLPKETKKKQTTKDQNQNLHSENSCR